MEIKAEVILEVDDPKIGSRDDYEARMELRDSIRNALEKCLGDKLKTVVVSVA